MPDEQQPKTPLENYERSLVAAPDETLRQQRDRLLSAVEATTQSLLCARSEVARLEERDRLLRAALADLDAALERLHLKPMRPPASATTPRPRQ